MATSCAALVNGNTLDCDFGQLNAGATITVVVTSGNTSLAHHCQGPSPDPSIDNGDTGPGTAGEAVAAATGVTPVSDSGSMTVTCPPPSLTIAKTPDGTGVGGTIAAGSPGVFTIVITNTSASTANNVTLDDVPPNDGGLTWTLTSATRTAPAPTNVATSCAALVNGNTLDCDFGQLNAGATITVVVTSGNTSLAHHCQGASPDPSINNGDTGPGTAGEAVAAATGVTPVSDSGSITVTCPPPTVTIEKTPDAAGDVGGTIAAGAAGMFTIKVKNTAGSTAHNVTITDTPD